MRVLLLTLLLTLLVFVQVQVVSAQPTAPAHETPETPPIGRMILGATLATFATVGAIYGVNYAITGGRDVEPFFIIPAVAVSPLFTAMGAHVAGRRNGGAGKYHPAVFGALIGTGLSGVLMIGTSRRAIMAAIIAAPILQAAGAAVGSWLSHRARSRSRVRLRASISPIRGGTNLSLTGLF